MGTHDGNHFDVLIFFVTSFPFTAPVVVVFPFHYAIYIIMNDFSRLHRFPTLDSKDDGFGKEDRARVEDERISHRGQFSLGQ